MWGIGALVSPHDLRVHNHNNILVLKRFYFKLSKKISLRISMLLFRHEHNILSPKFPATQGALTIPDTINNGKNLALFQLITHTI